MPTQSDEIFFLAADQLRPLPIRSMRLGLFGKKLEDALQELLQKYPQIIPGKQIDPSDPPRFVLLQREMPVGGWSLDHLYVDQNAVLTLIETKLVENPESRREVIGQIIEYAANATKLWTAEQVRQDAIEFWSKQGKDLNEVLSNEFSGGSDGLNIIDFWRSVEANLKDGQVRLIIVSDELRPEVRRMIEYLNGEMQNAEVLGLELKCYGQESTSLVLVPHLVGQTQANVDRRRPDKLPVQWTKDKLKTAFENFTPTDTAQKLRRVLDWSLSNQSFIESKAQLPSFGICGKGKYRILTIYSDEYVYLFFEQRLYPGGNEERDKLVNALKSLQMLDQDIDPQQAANGRNLVRRLSELNDDELAKFLDVLGEFCGQRIDYHETAHR